MKNDVRPVAYIGHKRKAHRVLIVKHDRNSRLGGPRFRWEGSIKTDRKLLGWERRDWTYLAKDWDSRLAFVNTVKKIRLP
jgi:hypothetical protein